MKILHILRSEPDTTVRTLIDEMSQGDKYLAVSLSGNGIDYDRLIREIFASDRVISWW